jgi:hypothetical protein
MNRNEQDFGDPKKQATMGCLRVVEERIELFQGCLHGKETVERPLLLEHIKRAQKQDAAILEAIDKDIANFKAQIKSLELQAKKFRTEIHGK